jgi:hypothetical protein
MKLVLGRYVLRIELCCLGNPEICLFYGFECLIASPIPPKASAQRARVLASEV